MELTQAEEAGDLNGLDDDRRKEVEKTLGPAARR